MTTRRDLVKGVVATGAALTFGSTAKAKAEPYTGGLNFSGPISAKVSAYDIPYKTPVTEEMVMHLWHQCYQQTGRKITRIQVNEDYNDSNFLGMSYPDKTISDKHGKIRITIFRLIPKGIIRAFFDKEKFLG